MTQVQESKRGVIIIQHTLTLLLLGSSALLGKSFPLVGRSNSPSSQTNIHTQKIFDGERERERVTELHEPCRSIRHADTHHRLRLYSQSYIYIYVSRVDTRRGQERSFCSKSSGVELVSSSSFPFTFSSPRRRRRKRRRNTHNSKEKKNNKKKEIKGKKGKGSHFLPLFGSGGKHG